MHDDPGAFRWRFPIGFQLIPLIVLAVGINLFPESPRWLLSKNRDDEAIEILASLRGDGDPNHPDVVQEVKEIREALRLEDSEGGAPTYWNMLFRYDEQNIPRRVHLSIWLQIIQELCGIGKCVT